VAFLNNKQKEVNPMAKSEQKKTPEVQTSSEKKKTIRVRWRKPKTRELIGDNRCKKERGLD